MTHGLCYLAMEDSALNRSAFSAGQNKMRSMPNGPIAASCFTTRLLRLEMR